MNGLCNHRLLAGLVVVFGALFSGFSVEHLEAQTTNRWATGVSGKWELATNWTINLPPANTSFVFIATALTKTVTIDATTVLSNSTMTISNLTLSAPAGSTNTLLLSDPGTNTPLRISNTLTISSGGSLVISNGVLRSDGAAAFANDGQLLLNSSNAWLVVTNKNTAVGSTGVGQMTVSNGTVLGKVLFVANSTGARGTLTIAGGITQLSDVLFVANSPNTTGAVWVTGGQLIVTNFSTSIGGIGVGQMTVSNGTVSSQFVTVGKSSGSQGTLTIVGGTAVLSSALTVGQNANATGAVTVAGGNLFVTNAAGTAALVVGQSGRGVYIQNGGTVSVDQLVVTNNPTDAVFQLLGGTLFTKASVYSNAALNVGTAGNSATLNFQGATHSFTNKLVLGPSAGSTGTVWMTASQLMVHRADIGLNGVGQMTVSNGTWQVGGFLGVGVFAGARGTLAIAGGTSSVFSNLTIGGFPCTPTGTVVIAGGNLFVTNSTGNAVLEVRTGSLILNSGVLTIDELVMTNTCASFSRTGGTLVYGTAVLDPNRDDDGDGISNGYEQTHGLDPLNAADAGSDNDGDGFTNLQEFQAGTDATNSASAFRITSITKVSSTNILITWMTGIGKTNALEKVAGGMGSFTNNFDTWFIVTNTVGTTTNYLDVGAIGINPARYYRVRLVP